MQRNLHQLHEQEMKEKHKQPHNKIWTLAEKTAAFQCPKVNDMTNANFLSKRLMQIPRAHEEASQITRVNQQLIRKFSILAIKSQCTSIDQETTIRMKK